MKNSLVKAILFLLLLTLIGLGIGLFLKIKKERSNPILNIEEIGVVEKNMIDSLKRDIEGKSQEIDHLKDSIKNIKTIRVYKVDSIRNLPTTEGVRFLKTKLREYESTYNSR